MCGSLFQRLKLYQVMQNANLDYENCALAKSFALLETTLVEGCKKDEIYHKA